MWLLTKLHGRSSAELDCTQRLLWKTLALELAVCCSGLRCGSDDGSSTPHMQALKQKQRGIRNKAMRTEPFSNRVSVTALQALWFWAYFGYSVSSLVCLLLRACSCNPSNTLRLVWQIACLIFEPSSSTHTRPTLRCAALIHIAKSVIKTNCLSSTNNFQTNSHLNAGKCGNRNKKHNSSCWCNGNKVDALASSR